MLCSGSGRSQLVFEFTESVALLSFGRAAGHIAGRRIALVDVQRKAWCYGASFAEAKSKSAILE
jgi:hypothetical protein